MTTDLITRFNTRLQPFLDGLDLPVRLVGQVRLVEKTEGKKVKKFPMPADENDPEPVLPNSALAMVVYWELVGKVQTLASRPSRSRHKATVRLIAWYDSRRLVPESGNVKTLLIRYLVHYLVGNPFASVPEGVQTLKMITGDVIQTRTDLFGSYTFDNDASQFMTLPYDAVGIDFHLTWWQNHACLPELNGALASACP